MLTRKINTGKLRFPLLLSLILHGVMALVLGFIIMDNEQQKIRESVAVEMVKSMKEKTPPLPRRITEIRESIIGLKKFNEPLAKAQFTPKTFGNPNFRITQKLDSPDLTSLAPVLGTEAKDFKTRLDISLPSTSARGTSIDKPGSGTGKPGIKQGDGPTGLIGGANIIEVALYGIARSIIGKNQSGKEDIVFLIDASGSMEENIIAVARYIIKMIDVFKESKLNYTLGVVKFNRVLKNNNIVVYAQTNDINQFKLVLRSIKCSGDESILDAIDVGLTQVKYRNLVDKTLILVTDEPIRARPRQEGTPQGLSRKDLLQNDLQEIIQKSIDKGIKISVIALDDETHKSLAKETSGVWFPIPRQ
jgi:hypothetical protein